MAGWTRKSGMIVALPMENVDTDQLIPARFMSVSREDGYGRYLLHDLRRDGQGLLRPDFPLNTGPAAQILLAGRNFGSGSSREAAVYALVDAGIFAVIATGFGDIFSTNAVNNGLLPALVSDADHAALSQALTVTKQAQIEINARKVTLGSVTVPFVLDETWAVKLANGWDDIDLTRSHTERIAAFAAERANHAPWAFPTRDDTDATEVSPSS